MKSFRANANSWFFFISTLDNFWTAVFGDKQEFANAAPFKNTYLVPYDFFFFIWTEICGRERH